MDVGAKVILIDIIFIVVSIIDIIFIDIIFIVVSIKVNIAIMVFSFLAWQVDDHHVGWLLWTLSSTVSEATMEQCV